MHAQLTASEQVEPPPPPVLSASEIDTASAVAVVDISSDPSAQQNGPAMNQYLSRRRSATVSHRSATDILGDGILKSLSGDAATSNAHVIAFGREAAGIKARTQMRAISVPMAMLAVIGVFCQVSFGGGIILLLSFSSSLYRNRCLSALFHALFVVVYFHSGSRTHFQYVCLVHSRC
jgi:hypothetical protein